MKSCEENKHFDAINPVSPGLPLKTSTLSIFIFQQSWEGAEIVLRPSKPLLEASGRTGRILVNYLFNISKIFTSPPIWRLLPALKISSTLWYQRVRMRCFAAYLLIQKFTQLSEVLVQPRHQGPMGWLHIFTSTSNILCGQMLLIWWSLFLTRDPSLSSWNTHSLLWYQRLPLQHW